VPAPDERERALDRVVAVIEKQFGGLFQRTAVTIRYSAQRPDARRPGRTGVVGRPGPLAASGVGAQPSRPLPVSSSVLRPLITIIQPSP
jgi:hypothetical protein